MKKQKEFDAFDLSAEINGVAMIISGLSCQCCAETDRLNDGPFQTALFGVAKYLDRIAEDLEQIGMK